MNEIKVEVVGKEAIYLQTKTEFITLCEIDIIKKILDITEAIMYRISVKKDKEWILLIGGGISPHYNISVEKNDITEVLKLHLDNLSNTIKLIEKGLK